uniref:Uncharacterized protein n=1 Tax=Arundo donax TaxID=35708 RepID=A0A0A9A3Y6_ARUDO
MSDDSCRLAGFKLSRCLILFDSIIGDGLVNNSEKKGVFLQIYYVYLNLQENIQCRPY